MYGKKELTHQEIIKDITEYEVYKRYLDNFRVNKVFNSPFRKDIHPSFGIFINKSGNLRWNDFSTRESGGCIDFVKKMFNCDYLQAIHIIKNDFKAIIGTNRDKVELSIHSIPKDDSGASIEVIPRNWNKGMDKVYWSQYNLSCEVLNKFDVIPVQELYIDNNLVAVHDNKNPIYAYLIDEGIYKILCPYNNRYKWTSNCKSYHYQGYNQLPWIGNLLVLSKSLKDVMVLSLFDIPAIAAQSESQQIDEHLISILARRFEQIIVFYDNDEAGILGAKKITDKYNIKSIIIPLEYKVKDISDFIKKYDMEKTQELIYKLINENRN